MTVVFEKESAGDKILKALGKKRAYRMPEGLYEKLGKYAYARAEKENLITALLRPNGQEPPEGWFYRQDNNETDSMDE
jgi:hypothetical protein